MNKLAEIQRRLKDIESSRKPVIKKQTAPLERMKRISAASPESLSNPEIHRILSMPVVRTMTTEEYDAFNRAHINAAAYKKGWRLFDIQCEMIAAYETFNGAAFGSICVGGGKTVTCIMIARAAYNKGIKKICLFIPPSVQEQFLMADVPWARSWLPVNYPIHALGGRSAKQRLAIAKSGHPGLYVLPYSLLSLPDSEELLTTIKPGLVIADEAHRIANPDSARTKRYRKYQEDENPEFVCMSGTLTSKTVREYHHLQRWALGKYAFLPHNWSDANLWAYMIDSDACEVQSDYREKSADAIIKLKRWAEQNFDEEIPYGTPGFRKAYRLRMTSAPGVVSSEDEQLGCSLIIRHQGIKDYQKSAGWSKLKQLMDQIKREWRTPSGDEIEYALHIFKWQYELGSGFYNELYWPEAEVLAKRHNWTLPEAEYILEKAQEHHEAQQEYHRVLRHFLQDTHISGLDTPMLVGNNMHHHGASNVPEYLYFAWKDWKNKDFPGRPDRDKRAVRVCDYKIRDAARWAKQAKRGIVWVHNIELGQWTHEIFKQEGIPCALCPSGRQYDAELREAIHKDKIVIASLGAHSEGKNLQYYFQQYFLQWPRPAKTAEQALGRMHRNGQTADEVDTTISIVTEFDRLNFAACLNDALYIHQTTGNKQKLIYADYDPLPAVFPHAVMEERGTEAKQLDGEHRDMLYRMGSLSG